MKWIRMMAMIFSAALALPAATPPPHPDIVYTKSVAESKILHKVMPQYPPDAADAHVQGVVKIKVLIGKDGHIERMHAIGGHPLLVPAAMQAVRQWTFEPSQLKGSPVRVVTEIDVPFQLERR